MSTCDTLEVDLSRVDLDITLEQYPCIDVEILSPDIVIEAVTVANQGPPGPTGPTGPMGPIGPVGPIGPIGPIGAQGVQGAPGVQGDIGPQGSVGPQGATGSQGPTGATGSQGSQGAQGVQGPAATIAVGTTTTGAPGSAASVTNSGSSSAAIFNFSVPQGPTGATGPPGPAGSGTGDMLRSVYDVNGDNVVDQAAAVPWVGITGKPATFAPSAHSSTHLSAGSDPIAVATSVLAGLCPAVDNTTIQIVASKLSTVALAWTAITGKPATFPPDSTAMLRATYDANSDNIVDHAALSDTAPWAGISGKPANFAPSAHASTHNLGGSDAIAPDWTQVQNKPATFPPSAHAASHVDGGSDIIVPASASTAGLLKKLSGLTTDFVDGTNTCQNLVTAVQPTIWSARLRSFNAIGNSTFEVAQRNVRGTLVNPANGTLLEDRWVCGNLGSLNPSFGSPQTTLTAGSGVVVPGTSFVITTAFVRITVGTQKASLAAGDANYLFQTVEGPRFRELMSDVHSVQLLVRSSVANLKFGLSLRDTGNTQSLTKLCTLGAANTITSIQLPNLPIWPSAGGFTAAVGSPSYTLSIVTAAGSTFTSPANNTFQAGNFLGALGQDNLMANAVGSTFEIFFVQHEPGAVCTTPIDYPWQQAYDDALRYYCKSYDYDIAAGSASAQAGMLGLIPSSTTLAEGAVRYPKPMAKVPTLTGYNPITGTANSLRHSNGTDYAISSFNNIGKSGFEAITTAAMAALALGQIVRVHYTADTGW